MARDRPRGVGVPATNVGGVGAAGVREPVPVRSSRVSITAGDSAASTVTTGVPPDGKGVGGDSRTDSFAGGGSSNR